VVDFDTEGVDIRQRRCRGRVKILATFYTLKQSSQWRNFQGDSVQSKCHSAYLSDLVESKYM